MLLSERVHIAAARADVFGLLQREGHEFASRAMRSALDSILGSGTPFEGVVQSWWDLEILSGESPSVKAKIGVRFEHAIFTFIVDLDARPMTPDGALAMEIMWS